jgi:hypothetical protein
MLPESKGKPMKILCRQSGEAEVSSNPFATPTLKEDGWPGPRSSPQQAVVPTTLSQGYSCRNNWIRSHYDVKCNCFLFHFFSSAKAPGVQGLVIIEDSQSYGHTTLSRTSLDKWSTRRRDLYLTTHNTQNIDIHAACEIRTHNLWKEQPQTHTLDGAATGIGVFAFTKYSPFHLRILRDEVNESWNSEQCQSLILWFCNVTDYTFTMFDNTENKYIVGRFVNKIAWYQHTHLKNM